MGQDAGKLGSEENKSTSGQPWDTVGHKAKNWKARKVNAKAKGSRNEHRTMQLLEAAGYRCTRAAASLGVFDIVGIGTSDLVLVQVKTRDWPGAVEMEQLREFRCPPNAEKLVHRWRDRARLPDVKEL